MSGPDQLGAPRLLDRARVVGEAVDSRQVGGKQVGGHCTAILRRLAIRDVRLRALAHDEAPSACSPSATDPRAGRRADVPRRPAPGTSSSRGRRCPGSRSITSPEKTYTPQLTQYGIRPPSLKPVITSSSPISTTPNGDAGRATAIVAAAPVSRCRRRSAPKSTATSSSPFSAKTSPRSSRSRAANLIPPPRPSRSGSSAQTISGASAPSASVKTSPCPAAHETITRSTPASASRAIWYAARGRSPIWTSDFGRPPAASPMRSAFPPGEDDRFHYCP